MAEVHEPVLLREAIDALGITSGEWYIDATVGLGGHALGILRQGGNVLGLDVDPEALERARKRLIEAGFDEKRFVLVKGNFRDLKKISLQTETEISGILFDLGVSSLQLDSPSRGFSFLKSGPLDMRMDPDLTVSALDLLKGLNKGELYELFTKLGEEKFARSLARALVGAGQITTTKDLAELVEEVYKRSSRAYALRKHGIRTWRIHPATKVFQALRIAVNDELNSLREALPQALEVIQKNGHIVVISFHSLEDRIVKTSFREWEALGFGRVLTKKPIVPTKAEVDYNPRSRSAKMRVFVKL